jgi:hypothetical protein
MGEYATSEDLPMALALSSPIAMDWWRMAGARIYPARFVEHVKKATAARDAESGSASSDAAV